MAYQYIPLYSSQDHLRPEDEFIRKLKRKIATLEEENAYQKTQEIYCRMDFLELDNFPIPKVLNPDIPGFSCCFTIIQQRITNI